jgi:hypothetical protein
VACLATEASRSPKQWYAHNFGGMIVVQVNRGSLAALDRQRFFATQVFGVT